MTKERAIALAVQCWCRPTTEMIVMDTRLAEVFASVLLKETAALEAHIKAANELEMAALEMDNNFNGTRYLSNDDTDKIRWDDLRLYLLKYAASKKRYRKWLRSYYND